MSTLDMKTSTGGSFSAYPDWYAQYVSDLTSMAGKLAQQPYTPYEGPRVAEWTPDQQAAMAGVRDAQGMWQPYVEDALGQMTKGQGALDQMRTMTQQAGQFDLPTYQNTYYGGVYEPTVQKMQQAARDIGAQEFENTTLKQLGDAFTGTGQFGSGRHQILGQDAAAAAQARIEQQVAGTEMQGRQQAMGDYLNWSKQQGQMGGQMGTLGANYARMGTDLMNFGLGTQQAAMADASALGNIGQQQQTQNQQNLNLAYQDFQEQQNYPWQQLDKWKATATQGMQIPVYQSSVQMPSVTPNTQQNPWVAGLTGGLGAWQTLNSSFKA